MDVGWWNCTTKVKLFRLPQSVRQKGQKHLGEFTRGCTRA
jgi:hypothetical protein